MFAIHHREELRREDIQTNRWFKRKTQLKPIAAIIHFSPAHTHIELAFKSANMLYIYITFYYAYHIPFA